VDFRVKVFQSVVTLGLTFRSLHRLESRLPYFKMHKVFTGDDPFLKVL